MNYEVKVNNINIEVRNSNIFPKPYNNKKLMEYCQFVINGETKIIVKSNTLVKSAIIRPLSLNLTPQIINNEIIVTISKPVNFSLEINESADNNLLVIVNPNRDYTESENTIYLKKGIHHIDILKIDKDNTTVYFEEGAYVYGKIYAENCKNLRILGQGVLSMEEVDWSVPLEKRRMIDIHYCDNVLISDIIIHDSVDWSLRMMGCSNSYIDNVKVIGSRGNSDGIDICGSQNIVVENCFLRVWDDALVVKAFNTGDASNITFKNCTVWNDFARPIEVGVELRADNVTNILFSNIDVIHSDTGYPIMGIHHGDRAVVSDITFRDIRIEDTPGAQLFDVRIVDSVWNRDDKKGYIRDINFENIQLIGKPGINILPAKSRLQGFSSECDIKGVTFKNIKLIGQSVTNLDALNITIQDYVSDVKIKNDNIENPLLSCESKLDIIDEFILQNDGRYHGKIRLTVTNKNDVPIPLKLWLDIFPKNTAIFNNDILDVELNANDCFSYDYNVILQAGKYAFSVNSNKLNVESDWIYLPLDVVINENKFTNFTFSNYYNDIKKDFYITVIENKLVIKSEHLDSGKLIIYSAIPVAEIENEVKFTVEETDFGEAMAIIKGKHGLELAPQLRCPAEITYVFKNEPKVKEIVINELSKNNYFEISFEKLGLFDNCSNFWLEIEYQNEYFSKYRYPYTLFHSVLPKNTAHMFGNVKIRRT